MRKICNEEREFGQSCLTLLLQGYCGASLRVKERNIYLTEPPVFFHDCCVILSSPLATDRVSIQGVSCSAVNLSVFCCFASLRRHLSGSHQRKLRFI